MRRFIRVGVLFVSLALAPAAARAEWQVKPFGGVTFGPSSTLLIDLDHEAGQPKLNLGVSGLWLGDVVGLEGDVATTAGFFSGDPSSPDTLILRSHVATVMGNAVVALPKNISQYRLATLRGGRAGQHARQHQRQPVCLPVHEMAVGLGCRRRRNRLPQRFRRTQLGCAVLQDSAD